MTSFIPENCGTPVLCDEVCTPSAPPAPPAMQFHRYIHAIPSAPPMPLELLPTYEEATAPSAPPMPSAWVPTPPPLPPEGSDSLPSAPPPAYEETMQTAARSQEASRSHRGFGIIKKSWKRVPSFFAKMKEATVAVQKLCQENFSLTESVLEQILRQSGVPMKNNRVIFEEDTNPFSLLKAECVANQFFLSHESSLDFRTVLLLLSLAQHRTTSSIL